MSHIEQVMMQRLGLNPEEFEPTDDTQTLAEIAYVNSELALALIELMEVV